MVTHLTGQRKPIEQTNRPAGRLYHILLPVGKEVFFVKKVLEIKREGGSIRVEIPKMSEDALFLVCITVIFCTLIHAIASAV